MKTFLLFLSITICISNASFSQEISRISSYQDYHNLTVKYINEHHPICEGYSARGEIFFYFNDEYTGSFISFDRVPGDHYELFDDELIQVEGEFIQKECSDGNTYYVFHAVKLEPLEIRKRQLILPKEFKTNELIEPEYIKR